MREMEEEEEEDEGEKELEVEEEEGDVLLLSFEGHDSLFETASE